MAYTLDKIDQIKDDQPYLLSEIANIIGISTSMLSIRRKVMDDHYQVRSGGKVPLRLVGRLWKYVLTHETLYVEGERP